MPVNKFVAIGWIALMFIGMIGVIGVIASINIARFDDEKRAARSEAKGYELACALLDSDTRLAEYAERDSKADPRNDKLRKKAFDAREEVIVGQKACQKIQEYKEKYEK